ncbi:MAG TPA: nuclease A inhibitor family protein [Nostocaceae cyanobacterium]|nr:nuclease A inhibitor family protein [Nostocaceae cyanobacterium]
MDKKFLVSISSAILLFMGLSTSSADASTFFSFIHKPSNSYFRLSQNKKITNDQTFITNAKQAETKNTKKITQKLTQASAGLLMISESEYPFTVVSLEGAAQENLTPQKVLELMGHSPTTPIEITDVDYFFRNVAVEQEWHDQQQRKDVKKFQKLVDILKSDLNEVKVYRVGTISIDVYILGKYNNEIVGIKTKVIET